MTAFARFTVPVPDDLSTVPDEDLVRMLIRISALAGAEAVASEPDPWGVRHRMAEEIASTDLTDAIEDPLFGEVLRRLAPRPTQEK